MKFRIETRVDIPRDEFWQVRGEMEYLNMYKEVGHLEDIRVVKEWEDADGTQHRVQSFTPKLLDVPDVAKALIANIVGTVDEHFTWNEQLAPYTQHFDSRPTAMPDVVHSSGTMTMDVDDEDSCIQTVEGEVQIKIPLIGMLCEESTVKNLEKFYKTTFRDVWKMYLERSRQLEGIDE